MTKEEGLSLFKMTKLTNGILLYRGSRDGFTGEAFHAKCDDKAKTVSIIKNNLNYVFGGYTSAKWTSNDEFITDRNAFIFSLRKKGVSNNQKFKIKNFELAIYGDSNYGPTFGENDIDIKNESNLFTGSFTNIGDSYECPQDCKPGTKNAKYYLSGAYNTWLVDEIEVFQRE
jgi:hypothetical protein